MAFDAYCKIEGIPGESSDKAHAKQIEVLSYDFGAAQAGGASVSRTGGQVGARADIGEFTIKKVVDTSTPNLFKYCASGKHIPSVVVEVCASAGDKHQYMKYTLSDVVISRLKSGGTGNGEGSRPVEDVSFRFGKVELEYTPYDNTGAKQASVKGGYDLAQNAVT